MKLKILVVLSVVGLAAGVVAWLAFPVSSFPVEWSRKVNGGDITWLLYSGDGSKLVYWVCDESVRVVDAATGEPLNGPPSNLKIFSVSADRLGRFLVIGTASEILIWDLVSGGEAGRRAFTGDWCARLVLSDDGTRLLVLMGTDLRAKVPSSSGNDCHKLAICRCDLAAGTIAPEHTPFECVEIRDCDLSGDGRMVAVANASDGSIQLLDAASGSELSRWTRVVPDMLRFTADPSFLVGLTGDGIERVDWKRQIVLERYDRPEEADGFFTPSIEVSTDRRRVGGVWPWKRIRPAHEVCGVLRVFDSASLAPLGTAWEGNRMGLFPEEQLWTATFSPDGRRIATSSSRGRLRSWIVAR